MKYSIRFTLLKCEFFYERLEYIGYDIMAGGNTTSQSKYDLIKKNL